MQLQPGSILSNYRIIKQIGRGHWAIVYQAQDISINRQIVAIKAIQKRLINDCPKLKELTSTEIQILRNCKNQNVIKYKDAFQSNDHIFIVTEFCNEGTMQEYLDKKVRLTQQEATVILKQILNGFSGLYRLNALHRDLKLVNILRHNSIIKIADFGFSKILEQGLSLTKTNLGTATTMAPQILARQKYGSKIDIWSIGIIYYQMIYGQYPYKPATNQQVLQQILRQGKPNLKRVKISKKAQNFIESCLQYNPRKRIGWNEIFKHELLHEKSPLLIGSSRIRQSIERQLVQNQQLFSNISYNEDCNSTLAMRGSQLFTTINIEPFNIDNLRDSKESLVKSIFQIGINKQIHFDEYQELYIKKRNNIIMLFIKYIHQETLRNQEIRSQIQNYAVLFLICKKVYLEMKQFLQTLLKELNIFNIQTYWQQFSKSQQYLKFIKQIQDQTICLQSILKDYAKQNNKKNDKNLQNQLNNINKLGEQFKITLENEIHYYKICFVDHFSKINSNEIRNSIIVILKTIEQIMKTTSTSDLEEYMKYIATINYDEAHKEIQKYVQIWKQI